MDFKFDWEKNEEKLNELKKVIEKHKDTKGAVMPVLHEAQHLFGYLPIEVQTIISEGLNVPLAEIYGVVTFYSQFTLIPKGQYKIGVCLGTACYVKGSQAILDKIKEKLNLQVGGTTPDRKFSLEATRCIGACGLAPVITINEDVYGRLKAEEVTGILDKYM
ncbi:NAD(P)H-dependent oxidoreductase subunit E [Proteiniborus sp. MB09-C3]|uniref:NADH-quinone oxidoreductase subunit NuoE family protein n=1 Tax=Proteiniborus sp. MB09-C3 TaxID=3050072 RepID=UPI002553AD38|nr:NAD(P)H-dependent oxidoreductase subunit E [Proteiniborus sp. MB09-C3]WIV12586.1 NAD(P)H-dependent oxidoreductase subunit E [Proteiniborus sp. MB09-C3]